MYNTSKNLKKLSTAQGNSLVIIAIMIFMLVTFLALAIYAGLSAYMQSELQKATTYAAGVGASSRFDAMAANGAPQQENGGTSSGAATTAFNALVAQSGALQSFGANAAAAANGNEVTVSATVDIPTGLFTFAGIDNVTIAAESTARYAQKEIPVAPFTMDTMAGPFSRTLTLDPPVLNGDGADFYIESTEATNGYHGYMVELCYAGGQCYDVSGAAKAADGNSVVVDRNYPSGQRRVLYGNFYFDIEATSPMYNGNVARATGLKILDDGIPDARSGANRFLELNPEPTQFNEITLYHQAVYCLQPGSCTAPPGFNFP